MARRAGPSRGRQHLAGHPGEVWAVPSPFAEVHVLRGRRSPPMHSTIQPKDICADV